ncbi:MAG TPA: STAS domain-containing protein [Acetobacteraceae bacterium]|nr:STAS domain-containing protein [Acetobacteraceae bacterium]
MEMLVETAVESVTRVILVGRLDIPGAQEIDLKFSAIVGSHRKIIVDLEQVPFIASMGIRTLIIGAKALKSKGGHMVLLNPTPDVEKVLLTFGADAIIPILHDLEAAILAVSS